VGDDSKRILIIEDSDVFADMLMEFLSTEGYSPERAVNGLEGIKKVYRFMPHLIISDVDMPVFKGHQVTRFLKARKNTMAIPVIMFSALGETKDKFWGTNAGADAYIEKSPDNFHFLREVITAILSESRYIDFGAIERESKKINDDSIIETVNGILDNKLFQTTIIGKLTELADKSFTLDIIAEKIFDLLHTICDAEIVTMMICGTRGTLYNYTANFAGFSDEISGNFLEISISDFNNLFPDFQVSEKITRLFFPSKDNRKKLMSYIAIPLAIGGSRFASVHAANSGNEYFTPGILENINVFLGAASPVMANALSMFELTELQKSTRTAFARYVPADVIDNIINETSKKAYVSENRNVTVLFCDIRNFTAISEHSDAQGVVDFLNNYFAKMGSEIILEGGHIDKFIGDALMAVFGAFQCLENAPSNAIKAAVKMLVAMEMINNSGTPLIKNKIEIGIGINCGGCILGNIGFKNKMDYTVIGDTVNLASRIESLTKFYRHPLIVSEYVYEATKEKYLFRKIDNVRVKGKNKPVGIYAVYSGFHGSDGKKLRSGETADVLTIAHLLINRETLINYNKGLQLFYMREWKLAEEYFLKALEADKKDYFSQLYLDRIKEFACTPPPDNWDGIITLSKK